MCIWEWDSLWDREYQGMGIKHRIGNGRELGNHLSGNGNYLHSHGNLFLKVLCCDELIKLLVLYLPDANAYCTICLTLKSEAEPECERFYYKLSDDK